MVPITQEKIVLIERVKLKDPAWVEYEGSSRKLHLEGALSPALQIPKVSGPYTQARH